MNIELKNVAYEYPDGNSELFYGQLYIKRKRAGIAYKDGKTFNTLKFSYYFKKKVGQFQVFNIIDNLII